MHEFLPAPRPSPWRVPLAALLAIVMFVPVFPLGVLLTSGMQVRYTIRDGTLTVDPGDPFTGVRTAPLSAIRESFTTDLSRGRRVAGTSLKGCCAGRWQFAELGTVWIATSCTRRGVFLRVQGEDLPWVLSPPDPEAFLVALQRGAPLDIALPAADKAPLDLLAMVVLPLVLLGGPALVAALWFGPGRLRYRVGPGWLEVETLYSRRRYPTRELQARRLRPARPWRLAGVSMPGYYTGWFRLEGKTTRLAATRIDEVVLVEGPVRLALSPADPDAFLVALGKAGARVG